MIIETDDGSTLSTHRASFKNETPQLVVEFHYDDGDVGAYNDDIDAAHELWSEFSASNPDLHKPTQIVIRLADKDGN